MSKSIEEVKEQAIKKALEQLAERNPRQANCLSALIAACDNKPRAVYDLGWDITSSIEVAVNKAKKNKTALEREEWLGTLEIGDAVELRVGARRNRHSSNKYGGYWNHGTLTKIYNGKNGVTYTVVLDTPHIYYRRPKGSCTDHYSSWEKRYVSRERKEKSTFKVKVADIRKPKV